MAVVTDRNGKQVEVVEDLLPKLEAALAELDNKTPDEIAEMVKGALAGEKAECGNANRCAIALYLLKRLNLPASYNISVGHYGTDVFHPDVWDPSVEGYAKHPATVADFIMRFDDGAYPELATEESLARYHGTTAA